MCGKMQESELADHFFHRHLGYLGPVSCIFLSAHLKEWLQPDGCQMADIVPSWLPWRAGITNDCDTFVY